MEGADDHAVREFRSRRRAQYKSGIDPDEERAKRYQNDVILRKADKHERLEQKRKIVVQNINSNSNATTGTTTGGLGLFLNSNYITTGTGTVLNNGDEIEAANQRMQELLRANLLVDREEQELVLRDVRDSAAEHQMDSSPGSSEMLSNADESRMSQNSEIGGSGQQLVSPATQQVGTPLASPAMHMAAQTRRGRGLGSPSVEILATEDIIDSMDQSGSDLDDHEDEEQNIFKKATSPTARSAANAHQELPLAKLYRVHNSVEECMLYCRTASMLELSRILHVAANSCAFQQQLRGTSSTTTNGSGTDHIDSDVGAGTSTTANHNSANMNDSTTDQPKEEFFVDEQLFVIRRVNPADTSPSLILEQVPIVVATVQETRKRLAREVSPPIQECIDAGMVRSLVTLMMEIEEANLRFELCWALTNIASGTQEQTAAVVQNGGLAGFLQVLQSRSALDPRVCVQSVWAIGNVAGDGPEYRDLLLHQGAIGLLQELYLHLPALSWVAAKKLDCVQNLMWTMGNLCRGKPKPRLSLVAPAYSVFADALLQDLDEKISYEALWGLCYLVQSAETSADDHMGCTIDTQSANLQPSASMLGGAAGAAGASSSTPVVVNNKTRTTREDLQQETLQACRAFLSAGERASFITKMLGAGAGSFALTRPAIDYTVFNHVDHDELIFEDDEGEDDIEIEVLDASNNTNGGPQDGGSPSLGANKNVRQRSSKLSTSSSSRSNPLVDALLVHFFRSMKNRWVVSKILGALTSCKDPAVVGATLRSRSLFPAFLAFLKFPEGRKLEELLHLLRKRERQALRLQQQNGTTRNRTSREQYTHVEDGFEFAMGPEGYSEKKLLQHKRECAYLLANVASSRYSEKFWELVLDPPNAGLQLVTGPLRKSPTGTTTGSTDSKMILGGGGGASPTSSQPALVYGTAAGGQPQSGQQGTSNGASAPLPLHPDLADFQEQIRAASRSGSKSAGGGADNTNSASLSNEDVENANMTPANNLSPGQQGQDNQSNSSLRKIHYTGICILRDAVQGILSSDTTCQRECALALARLIDKTYLERRVFLANELNIVKVFTDVVNSSLADTDPELKENCIKSLDTLFQFSVLHPCLDLNTKLQSWQRFEEADCPRVLSLHGTFSNTAERFARSMELWEQHVDEQMSSMSGWNNYNDISCIPADGETFRQKSQFSIVEQHRLRFSPNFGGGGSEENLSPSIHSLNSSQDTQMRIGIRTPLVSQDSEYNSTSRDNSPRRTGGTSSMAVEVDNINNSKAGTTSRPSPRAGGTTAAGASYRMFSHRYANRLIEDHDSAMKDGTTRQMNQSANNNNQLLSVALLNAISENTNDIEDDSDMHTPNSENKNSTSRSRQVSASSASLRNRNLYLDSLDSSDEGGGTNSNSLSFNASGSFGDSTLGKNKTSQQFFDFSPPQTRGSNAGTSASVQSFLGAGGVGGPQAQPQVEDRENISMMNF